MPQAFSQPVLWNPLQRWLKGNRLKPLPPHLRLSLLCLLRSVRAWGRGPCCCALLGPAALMGVGETLCSAFPSLHSVTSHHQLEIGQGGVFTQWKSVNCYKWRIFFSPGEQVVKHLPANLWSQVFSGQFPSRRCGCCHWGLCFKFSKEDSRSLWSFYHSFIRYLKGISDFSCLRWNMQISISHQPKYIPSLVFPRPVKGDSIISLIQA